MACRGCGSAELPTKGEIDRIVEEIAASRETAVGIRPIDEETRSRRILTCAACEALAMEILCAHCGCFIAARALDPLRKCPHPAGNRWAFGDETPAGESAAG